MEQNSTSNRLHALDGLRGIAIIMVFLSHINATFINRSTLFGGYFFDSGVLGVSFLFILSGFLMSYLYPQPKNKISFLQKRYTRIFPLFLTMCTILFILKLFSVTQWYVALGIVLILASISHSIWVFGIKRYLTGNNTKIIFFAFIAIQIAVGLFYLWIMHHQAVFYYDQLSFLSRSFTNWFVNATLMLPVGRYVEMLDPVYWSLAAEVLFYILYPFICAPIIAYMSQKSKITKILLLICLIPFFVSVVILSQHVLYLNLLRFQLFYYFVTGMTLGYVYRKNPELVSSIGRFFPGKLTYITLLLFFGFILLARIIELQYQTQAVWIQLFLSIPFTLLLALSLSNTTTLSKFFRSKILVYVGTVSYSIYLSHMFVLNLMIHIFGQPNSILFTVFYISITFLITILLSSILYFLLERPYFKRKYTEKKAGVILYEPNRNVPLMFGSISLGLLIIIFIVYQSNLNFFTLKQPINGSVIGPNKNNPLISLQKKPTVTIEFKASHNNLGVLAMHFIHESVPGKKFVTQQLDFRIRELGSKVWYSTSQYYVRHAADTLPVSFGFPLISDADGKTYIVSIVQMVPQSSEYFILDNGTNNIGGIFFIDKKTLITHPQQLLSFIENKFITVIDTKEAQQEFNLALPFILFSLFLFITGISNIKFKYQN